VAESPSNLRDRTIASAKRYLPPGFRKWVVSMQRKFHLQWPPAGTVGFGSLRRLTPISPIFAIDRGLPIERYYIEQFLDRYRADIRGRAMEFGDTFYLDKFGGEGLRQKDAFSVVAAPGVTIVGDLVGDGPLPVEAFDCIVCTQTLQMIVDMPAAVRRLHSMLKPGGVLLVTSHGISKIGRHLDTDKWGEYWRITQAGGRALFRDHFAGSSEVVGYGNVLSAISTLHGLAATELTKEELDHADRDYDVIVGIRAVKG
jgi:SAM-dependent methyltransferase